MWEFFVNHIGAILASLGALTGIGLFVLILVVGVPAAVILAKAIDLAKAIVTFFSTPLGIAVGIALLCLLCLFIGDLNGSRREIAQCKANDLKAQLAAARRDNAIQKAAAASADQIALDLRAYSAQLETKVQAYADDLAKRPPNGACVSTDADIQRLRGLAR